MQSGSLYNYFYLEGPDRRADHRAVPEGAPPALVPRHRPCMLTWPPAQAFERMVRASFDMMSTHRDACEVSQNDVRYLRNQPGLRYLRGRARRRLERLWARSDRGRGLKSGDFRSDIDPHLFHRFARDAMWFTVRWYRPDGLFTIDEIADQVPHHPDGRLRPIARGPRRPARRRRLGRVRKGMAPCARQRRLRAHPADPAAALCSDPDHFPGTRAHTASRPRWPRPSGGPRATGRCRSR